MSENEQEHELEAEAARIEMLIGEIRDLVTLPAWQRIEDVMRAIVHLYGAGLGRALDHARATGAEPAGFDQRLCEDELLASLLVLHGLHPLPAEERIARALVPLRAQLGIADDALAVEISDGVARISSRTGAVTPGLVEGMVRRAIEAAAPELTSIEIVGMPARRDPTLVQLRTSRSTP